MPATTQGGRSGNHPGSRPISEATRRVILKETEAAARALGLQLQFLEARGPDDFGKAFSEMTRARAGGLTVLTSIMFFSERRRLVELAAKYRLPAVYPWRGLSIRAAFWLMGPTFLTCFGAPQATWTSLSTLAVSRANVFVSDHWSLDVSSSRSGPHAVVVKGDTEVCPLGSIARSTPKARCVITRWPCATHLFGRERP
jgi:hypothetical protein